MIFIWGINVPFIILIFKNIPRVVLGVKKYIE